MIKFFRLAISILLVAGFSEAKINDVFFIQGRIHSFDRKDVRIESKTGAQIVVPRSAIATPFKLVASKDTQRIPVYAKNFSKIKTTVPQVFKWPSDRQAPSAKQTLLSLESEIISKPHAE